MRVCRVLSAFFVAAALIFSGASSASAFTSTSSESISIASSANSTAVIGGIVFNFSNSLTTPVYVLRTWRGVGTFYASSNGIYDAIIKPGQDTIDLGWTNSDGWYIPYHVRANTYKRNPATGQWEQHAGAPGNPALNRGWYFIGNDDWRVQVFACSC